MKLSTAIRYLLHLTLITTAHAACNPSNKPFQNRDELKIAIDTCFEGDDPATAATIAEYNPQKCNQEVKNTYGWPMNTWCVGDVDDMQLLFVGKRDFNEDISGELCVHISTAVVCIIYFE
jgi:hypothetical protein